jgi:hypothetical protein
MPARRVCQQLLLQEHAGDPHRTPPIRVPAARPRAHPPRPSALRALPSARAEAHDPRLTTRRFRMPRIDPPELSHQAMAKVLERRRLLTSMTAPINQILLFEPDVVIWWSIF